MARKGEPPVRPGRATRSNKTAGTESIDAESKDNAKNQPKPSPKAQSKPSPKPAPQRAEKGIKSSGKPKLNKKTTAWYNTGNKGAGVAGVLCGKQLAESSDREIWKQAVAALVGICHRNSFGDEELTREVGTALHRARKPRTSGPKCEGCLRPRPCYGLPAEGKMRWCGVCAQKNREGAIYLHGKKCEDCRDKYPGYGLPAVKGGDRAEKARWCKSCSEAHAGAMPRAPRCEDCLSHIRAYGLPGEGKKRWCLGCSKAYPGAINVKNDRCQSCKNRPASWGFRSADGEKPKARWCPACAKPHTSAVLVIGVACEDCGVNSLFGLPMEKKRRWCGTCAKSHPGAINLVHKRCETCKVKQANYGRPGDGYAKRWCAGCAKPGACITQSTEAASAQRSTKRRRANLEEADAGQP